MRQEDPATQSPARGAHGLIVTAVVLVVVGVILFFTVVGSVFGIPFLIAGVILGGYALAKRHRN